MTDKDKAVVLASCFDDLTKEISVKLAKAAGWVDPYKMLYTSSATPEPDCEAWEIYTDEAENLIMMTCMFSATALIDILMTCDKALALEYIKEEI